MAKDDGEVAQVDGIGSEDVIGDDMTGKSMVCGKEKKSFSLPAKPMREVISKTVTYKVSRVKKVYLVYVVMYVCR